jgi:hypothetical protein
MMSLADLRSEPRDCAVVCAFTDFIEFPSSFLFLLLSTVLSAVILMKAEAHGAGGCA